MYHGYKISPAAAQVSTDGSLTARRLMTFPGGGVSSTGSGGGDVQRAMRSAVDMEIWWECHGNMIGI